MHKNSEISNIGESNGKWNGKLYYTGIYRGLEKKRNHEIAWDCTVVAMGFIPHQSPARFISKV